MEISDQGYECPVFLLSAAGSRESDLMLALQMLLDKLNSGNIPLSQEQWDKMQSGQAAGMGVNTSTTTTNIVNTSGGAHLQVFIKLCVQEFAELISLFFMAVLIMLWTNELSVAGEQYQKMLNQYHALLKKFFITVRNKSVVNEGIKQ